MAENVNKGKIRVRVINAEGCAHCVPARHGVMAAAALAALYLPEVDIDLELVEGINAPIVEFYGNDAKIAVVEGLPSNEHVDFGGIAMLREYLRGFHDSFRYGINYGKADLPGLVALIHGFDNFIIKKNKEGLWSGCK